MKPLLLCDLASLVLMSKIEMEERTWTDTKTALALFTPNRRQD